MGHKKNGAAVEPKMIDMAGLCRRGNVSRDTVYNRFLPDPRFPASIQFAERGPNLWDLAAVDAYFDLLLAEAEAERQARLSATTVPPQVMPQKRRRRHAAMVV